MRQLADDPLWANMMQSGFETFRAPHVSMELLEREHALMVLSAARDDALAGNGRVVLVSGEAGIGKTSFVEHFQESHGAALRYFKGNCDALFTPSPLGPLYDIARQTGGRLLSLLERESPRAALFSATLDALRASDTPTLLLVEDVHWADDATLDLIKFLSRRIAQSSLLLILTYRDDEIGAPLRHLLGDLATMRSTIRIALPRLTEEAVRILAAGRPFDAKALHRQTSGNPFYVAEILTQGAHGVPTSVRDAVLARAARLSPPARRVLEAAAVVGSRMDHATLERVCASYADGLDECMALGLLEPAGAGMAFRHELVRDAVLSGLDTGRRRELHRAALAGLKAAGIGRGDLAQLAHFAEGAGDAESVLEYGPQAARAAAAMGAHRAAAAQYLRVLDFAALCTPAEQAQLHEAYAEECAIVDDLAEAIVARRAAIALWQKAGDRLKEGENLAALAWPLVRSGQNAAAEEASHRAIEVLETMPPTRQLASAYRIQAHLRMLDREGTVAVRWGRKAIELATRFRDVETLVASEIVVGSALLLDGHAKGRAHLDRSQVLAREAGLDAMVALAYLSLGSSYGEQYQFAEAERLLTEGIAYTGDRDLDHASHYMSAWLALTRLYQGRWSEAHDIARTVVDRPNVAAISRIMALVALGRVRARRGEAGAMEALDEALALALQTDTLQRLAPVRAARAEAAWLADRPGDVASEALAVYGLATRHHHRWHTGELAYWRIRAGEELAAPRWIALPFMSQIRGDWRRAADAWQELGCPYEHARALAEGDMPAQLQALEIFDELGAVPAAGALRRRMRGAGIRQIPRGPRATTRQNPYGLTTREMEILGCLADGLSNGGIGARLHVSPKTVDHHVSSVLAKLGAASRGEAARIARERHLLAKDREDVIAK